MLNSEFIAASDKNSRRLMVVLHGLGDSAAGYYWLPSTLGLSWMNYLLVNAPDDYFGGYSWYDFMGDARTGVERSRKLLVELLDAQRERGFPADQTTLFGFSQGCLMALETGFKYPHRLAGLVGISGYVHEPAELLSSLSHVARQQRVLVTHGTHDPLIPIDGTRAQIQRLRQEGLSIEWREFAKEHTIAGEEEIDLIRDFVAAGYPKS